MFLQVISRGLVMWDQIHPSEAWIESNLPEVEEGGIAAPVCSQEIEAFVSCTLMHHLDNLSLICL